MVEATEINLNKSEPNLQFESLAILQNTEISSLLETAPHFPGQIRIEMVAVEGQKVIIPATEYPPDYYSRREEYRMNLFNREVPPGRTCVRIFSDPRIRRRLGHISEVLSTTKSLGKEELKSHGLSDEKIRQRIEEAKSAFWQKLEEKPLSYEEATDEEIIKRTEEAKGTFWRKLK